MDSQIVAEKLHKLVDEVLDSPEHGNNFVKLFSELNLDRQAVTKCFIDYTLKIDELVNDDYQEMEMMAVLHINNLFTESYHQIRQSAVSKFLNNINPGKIVDVGFGVPSKYFFESINNKKVAGFDLFDRSNNALVFAEMLLKQVKINWQTNVSLKLYDMDDQLYIGDYDTYVFMDAIEHTQDPTKYLKSQIAQSKSTAKFIFSIPICKVETLKHAHNIEWLSEFDAETWLNSCGLKIVDKVVAKPNPDVDFFAEKIEGGYYNLVVLTEKEINSLQQKRYVELEEVIAKQPYDIQLNGLALTVDRNVFPPDFGFSSKLLAEYLESSGAKYLGNLKDGTAIDMGSGTGYLAMIMKKIGFREVFAIDNYDKAISCINNNLLSNLDLQNISVLKSDLFEKYQKNFFDMVVFNYPYYEVENPILGVTGEGGLKLISRFIKQAIQFMHRDSTVLLPFSDIVGEKKDFFKIANESGLRVHEVFSNTDKYGNNYIYALTKEITDDSIKDEIYNQYDNFDQTYDENESKFAKNWPEDQKILKNVSVDFKNKKVLDVGCGLGNYVRDLYDSGVDVYGIDSSIKSIENGQKKNIKVTDRLVHASFESIPYPDNTFDAIVSRFALHYAIDPIIGLKEINRVLKVGGEAHIFIAHPFLLFAHKKGAEYAEREIVELPILNDLVVNEPSHTFTDYLNTETLKIFDLVDFYEAKETYVESEINGTNKNVPTFFYLKLRKK